MTEKENQNSDTNIPGVWVDTAFQADFKVLGDEEINDILENVKCHRTCDRLGLPAPSEETLADLKLDKDHQGVPEPILRMWVSIDQKLDSLLRIVGEKSQRLENSKRGTITKISPRGLNMKSGKEGKKGERFLIRVSPPTFPPFTIDLVGRVVSVETVPPDNLCKLDFEAVNSDDRELLITYVFKRQRETLRSQLEDEYSAHFDREDDKQ